jgi:hypothetical protein
MLIIYCSSGFVTSLKEDEADGISEPKKKKKNKKHKEGDQSSESAGCDLMATSVEQQTVEPILKTKHKKRKRHSEDEVGVGAKRKKKKGEVENCKSVYCETPENEDLHFTHLSSEGAEYGTVLEAVKETYLNEAQGDSDSKAHKKKKKKKKEEKKKKKEEEHELHTDTNKDKETVAEVIDCREHANEGNGGEVVCYPDHTLSVKKMHKNKNKRKEKSVVDTTDLVTFTGVCKTSGKLVDNLHVSSTALASTSSSISFPGTSLQETDLVVKDVSRKAEKKFLECHSHNVKELLIQSKAEAFTASQKSPLIDKVESNSCIKDEYCRAKKQKRKKCDLRSETLPYVRNKNIKSTAKDELSVTVEKSGKHNLGSHTENKKEENLKTVPSTVELLNGAKSLISPSASGQDDLYTSSFLTPHIAAFQQTRVQETDTIVKGLSTKQKKKKMKRDSHIEESLDVQSKTDTHPSLQKSPVMKSMQTNANVIIQNHTAKAEKRKKCESHSQEPHNIQRKTSIPLCLEKSPVINTLATNSSIDVHLHTGNADEDQVIAVPSVADLLNRVKSKLKVKLPKKRKKKEELNKTLSEGSGVSKISHSVYDSKGTKHDSRELQLFAQCNDDHDETKSVNSGSHLLAFSHVENKREKSDKSHPNKQHLSKKSNDKSSVPFDPAALLAEYMSKFEAGRKNDAANECHSSMEDAADTTTSSTSFRSSFCLTGAGMANAADRKRKKMNKGKGDAVPVRRSLPLLPSSHSCSEADRPVGQDIVSSNSIKTSSGSLRSSTNKGDVLLTPEKCVTHNEVSRSPKTSISNTVEILASPKESSGSKLSFSPKQVTTPTSDSHLPTVVYPLSRKSSKEMSDINSPKTKDQTQILSGFMHHLNVSKSPAHDKSHSSCSGREFINASLILPHHSDVLQRFKSPLADSSTSAQMPVISSLQAKPVTEGSTDLVKETVTTEIKDKHKRKKKHKEKKSKIKTDKDRQHIERNQKKKKVEKHKRDKESEIKSGLGVQNEVVDRKVEHKEENTGNEGKQEKSKEKNTKGNLEDLKILTSKLFSNFLQQEK